MARSSVTATPGSGVEPPAPTVPQLRTAALAAGFGNLVEWFDFTTYGLLAAIIADHFFTGSGASGGAGPLLLTFATFGVGFLARPLGGVLIGLYGDRRGRKPALLLSIALMGVSTGAVAILPGYGTIGLAAPLLLVLARLAQGVAAGGEWGGAASFLVEWAPRGRRGLLGSFHTATIFVGTLVGSLVIAGLGSLLGQQAMSDWGWRLPFAIGALIAVVAIPVRLKAEETPVFAAESAPARNTTRDTTPTAVPSPPGRGPLVRRLAYTFALVGMQSAAVYTFTSYFPNFAQQYLTSGGDKITSSQALWSNAVASIVVIIVVVASGAASDRFGRKPGMVASCALVLVLAFPLVGWAVRADSFAVIIVIQCVLAASVALFLGNLPVVLVELFPARVRVAGLSSAYNLSSAVFGGFAPLIATALVSATGLPAAMSLWTVLAALISMIAVLRFTETRGVALV